MIRLAITHTLDGIYCLWSGTEIWNVRRWEARCTGTERIRRKHVMKRLRKEITPKSPGSRSVGLPDASSISVVEVSNILQITS
jgi:hypothetical protein